MNHCVKCGPVQYPQTDATVKEVILPGAGKMNLCKEHDPYRTSDPNASMHTSEGVYLTD